MRTNRTTLAAGLGAAGILGLGLYLAVPASAADPSPSASSTAKPDDADKDRPFWRGHGRHGHGPRGVGLRGHARHGVHGEATVEDGDAFRLVTWQRGDVTALSSTTLTVQSEDGATWTWTTNDDSRIRKDGEDVALKDLAKGDEILIAGERSGNTRTARFIRVRDAD